MDENDRGACANAVLGMLLSAIGALGIGWELDGGHGVFLASMCLCLVFGLIVFTVTLVRS